MVSSSLSVPEVEGQWRDTMQDSSSLSLPEGGGAVEGVEAELGCEEVFSARVHPRLRGDGDGAVVDEMSEVSSRQTRRI